MLRSFYMTVNSALALPRWKHERLKISAYLKWCVYRYTNLCIQNFGFTILFISSFL